MLGPGKNTGDFVSVTNKILTDKREITGTIVTYSPLASYIIPSRRRTRMLLGNLWSSELMASCNKGKQFVVKWTDSQQREIICPNVTTNGNITSTFYNNVTMFICYIQQCNYVDMLHKTMLKSYIQQCNYVHMLHIIMLICYIQQYNCSYVTNNNATMFICFIQ